MERNEREREQRRARRKSGFFLAALTVGMLAMPFPAMAEEEEREPIEEVVLDISSSIEVGDVSSDVDVSSDSDEYEVGTVDVVNEPMDKWKHKDKPKLEITLEADSDYYFKSGFSKKKISLTGDSATVTSVKRKSKEEVRVVVTLKALKGTDSDFELELEEAEWDLLDGIAEWDDAEDAKYYELRLYRDGKFLTNVRPIHDTTCALGRYMNEAGSYTFEVRAVYSDSRKGDWQESDSFDISAERAAEITAAAAYKMSGAGPAEGVWEQDEQGFRYRNFDQTYTMNNWQQIGGSWYFFDENGYRKTGWLTWQDKTYYLDENGVMAANAVVPDGRQAGADGAVY